MEEGFEKNDGVYSKKIGFSNAILIKIEVQDNMKRLKCCNSYYNGIYKTKIIKTKIPFGPIKKSHIEMMNVLNQIPEELYW